MLAKRLLPDAQQTQPACEHPMGSGETESKGLMINIAIVGDIHHFFAQFDVDYFNQADYDLLLLTGDIPFQSSGAERQLLGRLSALRKPALLIPGNHDCATKAQFLAEATGQSWLGAIGRPGQEQLVNELRDGLEPVVLCGYSTHAYRFADRDLAVIAARPLSFGGPDLSYRAYLQSSFAVDSVQTSAERLQQLIAGSAAGDLLFLSHNGPSGLGASAEDIWGCDFKPEAGDYGDPDLEMAIHYARKIGKRVPAVVAGHMHHALQTGGSRRWLVQRDETSYINAARVPRIFNLDGRVIHHHIALRITPDRSVVEEMLVDGGGQ